MRKLRSVEWFGGSGRLSFALMNAGWECVIHDSDEAAVEWAEHGSEPTAANYWKTDFMKVDRRALMMGKAYDYFHFSVDCSSFSGLSQAVHRRMAYNNHCGETPACKAGNQMLARSLDMINDQLEVNPRFLFTLENPQGGMQRHPLIASRLELPRNDGGLGAVRCRINYCFFADSADEAFLKPTVFWTNCNAIVRVFGTEQEVDGALPPQFACTSSTPCGRKHTPVRGNTSMATPFPRKLATMLALLINTEASSSRFVGV
jgi:hypothetical protein